jgi:hypothetical protein
MRKNLATDAVAADKTRTLLVDFLRISTSNHQGCCVRMQRSTWIMAVTAHDFSTALQAALDVEQPLLLTLLDGHRHTVLFPVLITEHEVCFAGPRPDRRVVVACAEIAYLEVAGQKVALHDRLTALLLQAELSQHPARQKASSFGIGDSRVARR